MIAATFALSALGFTAPSGVSQQLAATAVSRATRATTVRLSAEPPEDELNFDMGLLKLPRMVTPQQASFEAYRERRQKEVRRRTAEPGDFADDPKGPTPLGMDPVEGDPVDLRELYANEGRPAQPTDAEMRSADAEFESLFRGEGPPGLGDGIDDLLS